MNLKRDMVIPNNMFIENKFNLTMNCLIIEKYGLKDLLIKLIIYY